MALLKRNPTLLGDQQAQLPLDLTIPENPTRMAVEVEVRTIPSLFPFEVDQLEQLTFGEGGLLLERLRSYVRKGYDTGARAIIAWPTAEAFETKPLGWMLMMSDIGESQQYVYSFVDPGYRRLGIGRQLMLQALDLDPSVQVCPYNHLSRDFYRGFDVQCYGQYHW